MSLYEQTAKALRLLELQKTVDLKRPAGVGLQSFRSTIYNVLANVRKKATVKTLETGDIRVTLEDGYDGIVLISLEFNETLFAASSALIGAGLIQGIEFVGTGMGEVNDMLQSYAEPMVRLIETKKGTLLRGLTLTEQQLINLPGDEENEGKTSEQGQNASTFIAADAAGE
jgi:hypothetical protein